MSDDTDIDGLAAEYVLGSLPPAERLAVAQRIAGDKALANAVENWQRRLAPLSHREPGLVPPLQSIERLLAEIARRAIVGQKSETVVALRRAKRWRMATAGLAAASVALAITLGTLIENQSKTAGPLVAVLANGDNTTADEPTGSATPVFLAACDPATTVLTVRQIAGRRPAAERAYVLWLSARAGAPVKFIGLLSKTGPATSFPVPLFAYRDWAGATLVVSLEGSSIGTAPAGPILSTGLFAPAAH